MTIIMFTCTLCIHQRLETCATTSVVGVLTVVVHTHTHYLRDVCTVCNTILFVCDVRTQTQADEAQQLEFAEQSVQQHVTVLTGAVALFVHPTIMIKLLGLIIRILTARL
jgi:hypothetical protein